MREYICRDCKEDLTVIKSVSVPEENMKYVTYKCSGCGRIIKDNPEQMEDIEVAYTAIKYALGLDNSIDKKEDGVDMIGYENTKDRYDRKVDMIDDNKDSIDKYESMCYGNTLYYMTKEQLTDLMNGRLIAINNGEYTNMIKLVEE